MGTHIKNKVELSMVAEIEHQQPDSLQVLMREFVGYLRAAEPYLPQPLAPMVLLQEFERQLGVHLPSREAEAEPSTSDEAEGGTSGSTWEELDALLMPALPDDWETENSIKLGDAIGIELAKILETHREKAQHTLFQTNLSQLHLLLMEELGITFVDPRDLKTGAERLIHEAVRRRLFKSAPSEYLVREPVRSYKNKLLEKVRVRDPYDPDRENEYYTFVPGTGQRLALRKAHNLGITDSHVFRQVAQRIRENFPTELHELIQLSREVEAAPKLTGEPDQSTS